MDQKPALQLTDFRHGLINNFAGDQFNHYGIVNPSQDQHLPAELATKTLEKLKPAQMDATDRGECLEGTQTAMTRFIMDWALDPVGNENLLWIHGVAGSGKSTISTTIANRLYEMGRLGAFLFFNRDVKERSDPSTVIRTLAYQLGSYHPHVGAAVCDAIEAHPNIQQFPINSQYQQLIANVLSSDGVLDPNIPIVIVLDALDECGSAKQREKVLGVLSRNPSQLPPCVRIVVTSRPERDIRAFFEFQDHISVRELDITTKEISQDINSYLRQRLLHISRKTPRLRTQVIWPSEDVILRLTERASGLFVWASTASEFIDAYDPQARIDILLQGNVDSGAEHALDNLYITALESAGSWDDEAFVADFKAIAGLVLLARHPLSNNTIDVLRGSTRRLPCIDVISQLGCVLQQHPTVRLLHPSFADFLFDQRRCSREEWAVSSAVSNRDLAMNCLQHLKNVLRQNICDLTLSPETVNGDLSEDVSYACLCWIDHVCAIKEDVAPVMQNILLFLRRHLLHWFEAMSILKRSRDVIMLLDCLLVWVSSRSPSSSDLLEFVHDGCRFARRFASEIEMHPLLVYRTALPFTASKSSIYRMFHDPQLHPSVAGGYEQYWSPLLQTIVTDASIVSVAFSSDGTRIASGSTTARVQVWDAVSGMELPIILQGHENGVTSVNFSPNGSRIISSSSDGTVRIWDTMSGNNLLTGLRGHGGHVSSVAFSPDGTRVITGSDDQTIRVWDSTSGIEILPAFQGHEDYVTSVFYSPDGTRIVSGSWDRTVRVWDAMTGVETLPSLHGHSGIVRSVAFSPDGTLIVSGSDDHTVRVWGTMSGVEIFPTLRGHDDAVRSVSFSPNGIHIVTGSSDGTIRIWSTIYGIESVLVLRGHEGRVNSAIFSPDGMRVLSGSLDSTIRIWDATSTSDMKSPQVLRDTDSNVEPATLLTVGSVLNSGTHEKLIRKSNVTSMICGTSESTPMESEYTRWISKRTNKRQPEHISDYYYYLKYQQTQNSNQIIALAFSADGMRVVSGSCDWTIRVWDAKLGVALLPPLNGHESIVTCVTFSLDGARIASGSFDRTIRIWDAESGHQILLPIIGHNSTVGAIAFSPNGNSLVSGSADGTIQVWDATSGTKALSPMQGHKHGIGAVAFSPDGTRIVSSSSDSVRVWSTYLGVMILPPLQSRGNHSAIFSPDGSRVNYNSLDGTKTWDLESGSHHSSPTLGLKLVNEGWIVDNATDLYISKLITHFPMSCFEAQGRSLAIGTVHGRVFVMSFPPSL